MNVLIIEDEGLAARRLTKLLAGFNHKLSLTLKPQSSGEVIVSRERVADFKTWMGK